MFAFSSPIKIFSIFHKRNLTYRGINGKLDIVEIGREADTYKYKYSKATDELISKEFEAHSEYARRDKVVAVVRQATEPPVTDPPPTDPPETDPPTDPPTEPETPPASETEGSNE